MKTLIRSMTWVDPSEKPTATENLRALEVSRLVDLSKKEADLIQDLVTFFLNGGEAPALSLLIKQAEVANDVERVELLEEVQLQTHFSGQSFKQHLEEVVEMQSSDKLIGVLKTAAKIAKQGEKIGTAIEKGTDAAVRYVFSSVQEKPKALTSKLPNSQRDATKGLEDIYQSRKSNPTEAYGIMTGYGVIDASTGGIRKGQLMVHAGFTGHLKSTSMFNMIVNAAVDGGWNPILFTSEMPQADVMFLLVAIHSANPKFNTTHPPLAATRLLRGQMSPQEEAFYKMVQDNLVNDSAHGLIRVVDTSEFTTFGSVMQRANQEHSKEEVDQIWVDYLARLPIDLKYSRYSPTEAINATIADAKRFALSFDKGNKVAMCTPFQINREGYKRAKDNGGKLDLTMLAQFNAAEKEADAVTGIFFGEEEQLTNEPKLTVMKSRWGKVNATPASLFCDPDSRRISDMTQGAFIPGAIGGGGGLPTEDKVEI